jgi:hypothetical protein
MTDMRELFDAARDEALRYRLSLGTRPHRPECDYRQMRDRFREPTPEEPSAGVSVIQELAERANPGLMGMARTAVLRLGDWRVRPCRCRRRTYPTCHRMCPGRRNLFRGPCPVERQVGDADFRDLRRNDRRRWSAFDRGDP